MEKNNQYKIIIITLIVFILCFIGLFVLLIQSNNKISTGMYNIKCNNGSVVSFNRSDLLVCNGPNPFNMPGENKIDINILK